MNIVSAQLGFGTEVENKISLNIYVAGCLNNKQCNIKKCHNPKLRSFNIGIPYKEFLSNIDEILKKEDLLDCVVILGGEPLDQNFKDLKDLILHIKFISKLPIYIYTGYRFEDKRNTIKKLFNIGVMGFCIGEFQKKNKKNWVLL